MVRTATELLILLLCLSFQLPRQLQEKFVRVEKIQNSELLDIVSILDEMSVTLDYDDNEAMRWLKTIYTNMYSYKAQQTKKADNKCKKYASEMRQVGGIKVLLRMLMINTVLAPESQFSKGKIIDILLCWLFVICSNSPILVIYVRRFRSLFLYCRHIIKVTNQSHDSANLSKMRNFGKGYEMHLIFNQINALQ